MDSAIALHRQETRDLAHSLSGNEVYAWLVDYGYFPENYVLPPCFSVALRPKIAKSFFEVTKKGKTFEVDRSECVKVHYPKTELTDRVYGLIEPRIHNDIAYHLSQNWKTIVDAMLPLQSEVTTYSFPIPIDRQKPGRLSYLRSGRMIYEFIAMTDADLASVAYRYTHVIKADIKNFYPSIYTHSLAWAIHGKEFIRKPKNLHDFSHLGNRLDRLFQRANDGCTNGLPIGPVVSDIAAEIIAAAVDVLLTKAIKKKGIICEAVRFKDDYRILVRSEFDGRAVIKMLQAALKEYNLELSDEKTSISQLPDGLFREWVSRYHAVYPRRRSRFSWKQFRELYLAVIDIDRRCPGTGVVDRFLADIVTAKGRLKLVVGVYNVEKVISMLLMLANLRVKSFPKIMAILESILKDPFGIANTAQIVEYLESYTLKLAGDEERNKYLLCWMGYFLVSNDLLKSLKTRPKMVDPITSSVFSNRGLIFSSCKEFKLFVGCKKAAKGVSMFEHLNVFSPPTS